MTLSDSPWFVRRRGCCDLMPASLGGWTMTALYTAIIAWIAEWVARHDGAHLAVVIAAIVGITALYVGLAWRLSGPAPAGSRRGRCGTPKE